MILGVFIVVITVVAFNLGKRLTICSNRYKDKYDFCTDRMIVQIAEHRFYPTKIHVVCSLL